MTRYFLPRDARDSRLPPRVCRYTRQLDDPARTASAAGLPAFRPRGTRPPPARRLRRRARTGSCMAGIPEDSEADDAMRIFRRFLASMRGQHR
jgi:hypothetical protein